MCRWLAYIGTPIAPEKYLYQEQFSLIDQSLNARKSKSVVNGDGCGLGWYKDKPEPGLFRDILPAWSDENLRSLSNQISSRLFMAHVRAATDTPSNRTNCHPFKSENSLFMHNGQVGGYLKIRRDLENLIPDQYYPYRLGTTDSEILFLVLESLLVKYVFHEAIERLINHVKNICWDHSIDAPFRFTAAYSEGTNLNAVRYATDQYAPSLYYEFTQGGCLLVSEPLDNQTNHWHLVNENHTLEINHATNKPIIREIVP